MREEEDTAHLLKLRQTESEEPEHYSEEEERSFEEATRGEEADPP